MAVNVLRDTGKDNVYKPTLKEGRVLYRGDFQSDF